MIEADGFRKRLALWYHAERRVLPWRENPEPYPVWLSEIMLQQTQVATVIPYFERFLSTFPTIQSLADAAEDEVLTQWSGLGYYRRARLLHKAAQVIRDTYAGVLPADSAELLKLPGIGPYTARAIASIAHGEPVAVLDGNVARVLSRWVRLEHAVDGTEGNRTLWQLAQRVLDETDPSSHNQAMMELGALICLPSSPRCTACPVAGLCKAHAEGDEENYPRKKPKAKARTMREVAGYIQRDDGRFLMAQRPADGLLGSMWELPGGTKLPRRSSAKSLASALRERLLVQPHVGCVRGRVEHVFSHRKLELEILDAHLSEGDLAAHRNNLTFYQDTRWVHPDDLSSMPLSSLARKVLECLEVLDVK